MSKPTTFRFSFGPAPRAARWGVLAALLAAMPVAFADPYDGQAEWAQRYDAAERLTVSRSTTPILSAQTVAATEEAIRQYQEIVANGGWPSLPAGVQLRLGSNGTAVSTLRKRLIVSGDIAGETGYSPVFDSYVEAAVRRFQARQGINETGVVPGSAKAALRFRERWP